MRLTPNAVQMTKKTSTLRPNIGGLNRGDSTESVSNALVGKEISGVYHSARTSKGTLNVRMEPP